MLKCNAVEAKRLKVLLNLVQVWSGLIWCKVGWRTVSSGLGIMMPSVVLVELSSASLLVLQGLVLHGQVTSSIVTAMFHTVSL